ncbi:MAG: four helix bundle protein [Candidatus Marinimicrobia bacterium]|nr:four helix bundle protein [Candidatus Neomarinimicrobiota bacterium]
MKKYSFEKLEVWVLSKEFVKNIYKITSKLPQSEKYGIINQLQRACVSVPTNLSEGSGRNSGKDKAYFTQIAYGSLMECLNLLIIANELEFIQKEYIDTMRKDIEIISKKLSNLRRYQLNH